MSSALNFSPWAADLLIECSLFYLSCNETDFVDKCFHARHPVNSNEFLIFRNLLGSPPRVFYSVKSAPIELEIPCRVHESESEDSVHIWSFFALSVFCVEIKVQHRTRNCLLALLSLEPGRCLTVWEGDLNWLYRELLIVVNVLNSDRLQLDFFSILHVHEIFLLWPLELNLVIGDFTIHTGNSWQFRFNQSLLSFNDPCLLSKLFNLSLIRSLYFFENVELCIQLILLLVSDFLPNPKVRGHQLLKLVQVELQAGKVIFHLTS